jgi:putative ABC transport system permease protein
LRKESLRLQEAFAIANTKAQSPPGFAFPPEDQVDVWTVLPASVLASTERAERGYRVAAKLRPGVTPQMAQAALNVVTHRLSDQYAEDRDYGAVVIPMREGVAGDFQIPLCINIGYLRQVHLEARGQEIAVRLALGARRGTLVRQLLIETLLLFSVGGGMGILLAPAGVQLLLSYVPAREIPWLHPRTGGVAPAGAICFTVVAVVFSGLLPMIRTLRTEFAPGLTVGRSMGHSGERGRLRRAIIATQIAMAFIPLCGATLLMRSFVELQEVKLGFDSEHRMTLALSAPKGRYTGPAEITALANEILAKTRAIPGLKQEGFAQAIPFTTGARWLQAISRSDPKSLLSVATLPLVRYSVVTPGYFEAMGIPLRAGRLVADSDTRDAQPVVVINEKLARLYFPSENPVGKLLWIGHAESLPGSAPRTIAGVVGDTTMYALDRDPDPAAWVPMAQQIASDSIWRNLYLVANTEGDPGQISQTLREHIKGIDPDLATTDISWMTERVSDSLWRQRLSSRILGASSLAALGIALLGVFGVTSYVVARRSREIGIRMAMGASLEDIWKIVLAHNFVQVIIGLAVGVAGSIALTRVLQGLLFGVRPGDPLTFAAVAGALALAALVASFVPAHRAARIDPVLALRTE